MNKLIFKDVRKEWVKMILSGECYKTYLDAWHALDELTWYTKKCGFDFEFKVRYCDVMNVFCLINAKPETARALMTALLT